MSKSKHSSRAAVTTKLAQRLPLYGAVLAVAGPSAHAAIVYVGSGFSVNASNPNVNWDINSDSTVDFSFRFGSSTSGHLIVASQAGPFQRFMVATSHGPNHPLPLAAGQTIGTISPPHGHFAPVAASAIFTNGHTAYAPLTPGTQYVGFEFGNSLDPTYGWASITITTAQLTVNSWAYNSVAGQSIQAGEGSPVPEPAQAATGLGLLALGAVGVSAYKRRRQKAA